MKEKTIGQLLQFVRNNKNMRMKDVCEGICDSTTYSRYETGEYIPDMFTAGFLLERMEVDSSGIQYVSSYEEAEALVIRKTLQNALHSGELLDNESLIDYYKKNYSRKKAHRQYITFYEGKLQELKGLTEDAERLYLEGYLITHKDKKNLTQPYFSKQELGLLISYLRITKSKEYWQELYQYLLGKDKYNVLKMVFTADVAIGFCESGAADGEDPLMINASLQYLKEINALKGTWQLLKYKQNNSSKTGRLTQDEKNLYDAITELELQIPNDGKEFRRWTKGDLLHSLRKELGLTQEELSDGICDVTVLARYESGKLDPGKEKLELLLNRMHRSGVNYKFSYNSGTMYNIENYMEMEKSVERHDVKDGINKFYSNAVLMNSFMDDMEKTQMNEEVAIVRKYSEGNIDQKTYIAELEKLIKRSIPEFKDGKFSYNRIMNETEISILNIIGVAYRNNDETAKSMALYDNVEKYVYEHNMPFNKAIVKALNNYSDFLMLDGDYDKSSELSKKVMTSILEYDSQSMLFITVYHMACSLYAQNAWNSRQTIRCLELSHALAVYFNESNVAIDVIEKYLDIEFHIKLK